MSKVNNNWKPVSWYCPNCGTLQQGWQGEDGVTKAECLKCHTVMVRKCKKGALDVLKLYAPDQNKESKSTATQSNTLV